MNTLTDKEVLQAAGLDFEVKQSHVQYLDTNGKLVTDEQRFVNYREDTGQRLGIVSDQYEIVQFKDSIIPVYRQMQEVSKDFAVSSTFEGGRFMTRFLLNTDAVVPYKNGKETAKIMFDSINSFDGSRRFTGMLNLLRLICTNLTYAMQPALKLGGIHMKGTLDMSNLPGLGEEILRYKDEYVMFYKKLVDIEVKKRHVAEIEHEMVKNNTMFTQAMDNFGDHSGTNAWELYNEFTYLNSHRKIQAQTKQKKDMILSSLFTKVFV